MRARALAALAAAVLGGCATTPGLHVELTDRAVEADLAAVPAGHLRIAIHNGGTTVHELAVLRTDKPADALTYDDGAAAVKERGIVGERENIAVGKVKYLSVDLEPGSYVLFCNLPTHYALGMRATLVVR